MSAHQKLKRSSAGKHFREANKRGSSQPEQCNSNGRKIFKMRKNVNTINVSLAFESDYRHYDASV
jgi:hypothetical protein